MSLSTITDKLITIWCETYTHEMVNLTQDEITMCFHDSITQLISHLYIVSQSQCKTLQTQIDMTIWTEVLTRMAHSHSLERDLPNRQPVWRAHMWIGCSAMSKLLQNKLWVDDSNPFDQCPSSKKSLCTMNGALSSNTKMTWTKKQIEYTKSRWRIDNKITKPSLIVKWCRPICSVVEVLELNAWGKRWWCRRKGERIRRQSTKKRMISL